MTRPFGELPGMTNARAAEPHLVYPGGPACNPNCPGEHSMYHDGYADGFEQAEASAPVAQPAPLDERMDGVRKGIERAIRYLDGGHRGHAIVTLRETLDRARLAAADSQPSASEEERT